MDRSKLKRINELLKSCRIPPLRNKGAQRQQRRLEGYWSGRRITSEHRLDSPLKMINLYHIIIVFITIDIG